jgi:hypothetical protein
VTPLTARATETARPPAGRHTLPLAILLLGIAGCGTAIAATNTGVPCDHVADMQSLRVPAGDLMVRLVGHSVAAADAEPEEALAALDALPLQDASAPMLYLTPRVAAILRDIFSAVAIETLTRNPAGGQQAYAIDVLPQNDSHLSPVASDAATADAPESGDSTDGIEDMAGDKSFLRQMFRTDI